MIESLWNKCTEHSWFEKAEELDTEDYLPMSERALDSITLSKEISKGIKTLVNLLVNFGSTEQHKELMWIYENLDPLNSHTLKIGTIIGRIEQSDIEIPDTYLSNVKTKLLHLKHEAVNYAELFDSVKCVKEILIENKLQTTFGKFDSHNIGMISKANLKE